MISFDRKKVFKVRQYGMLSPEANERHKSPQALHRAGLGWEESEGKGNGGDDTYWIILVLWGAQWSGVLSEKHS